MKNILFICSENKLRSPTAEQIFSGREGFDVRSAGTNNNSRSCVSEELFEWADVIAVMEAAHQQKIRQRFRHLLKSQKIVILGIPDEYRFMQPELISILRRPGRAFVQVAKSHRYRRSRPTSAAST